MTSGMLCADGFAVFFGRKFTDKISMTWVHLAASIWFILFGIAISIGF